MTAVDTVEDEVRELVRRRGIDPLTDRAAVRRLVYEVVADDDERALTSTLPSLPDPKAAVEEIWINGRLTGCSVVNRKLGSPAGRTACAGP